MKTLITFFLAFLAVLVVIMGFSGCTITMPSSELLPIGKLVNIVRLDEQSYKLYFSNNQTCIADAFTVDKIVIGQYYQIIITINTRFLLLSKNYSPYPPIVYGELVSVSPPDGETMEYLPTVTSSTNATYWVVGYFISPVTLDAKYEWKPAPVGQIVGFNK